MKPARSILALAALLAACRLLADDPGVADDAYRRLLTRSAALIQEALADEKPNRRAADRARVVALLLAEAAQQDLTGTDAGSRAAVRDGALAIARQVREQQFAQAKKLAGALAQLTPQQAFKMEKVKLIGPHLAMDELMAVFRSTRLGGLNIEDELYRLEQDAQGQKLGAAELNGSLEILAEQTALTGGLLLDHQPDKDVAKWRQWAETMRRNGQDLARAVRAKDGTAAFRVVVQANANCTACHKAFR